MPSVPFSVSTTRAHHSEDKENDAENQPPNKKQKIEEPKRPMSAYFLFSIANRPVVKKENPDAGFGDMARIISENCKKLKAKDRKQWEKKAKDYKARYEEEMLHYEAHLMTQREQTLENVKQLDEKSKDYQNHVREAMAVIAPDVYADDDEYSWPLPWAPSSPKRDKAAHLHYGDHVRAKIKLEHPKACFGAVAKIIHSNFEALSAQERNIWKAVATADRELSARCKV